MTIDEINAHLRSAVDIRCDLHQRRGRGEITVYEYVLGLRWVRDQEDRLEPVRAEAGYNFSRAFELCHARTDFTGPTTFWDALSPVE